MTDTTLTGDEIPARHLVTTLPGAVGTLWLYGYRGYDLTARFSLVVDTEGTATTVFHNVDWPAAWEAMAGRLYPADLLGDLLRSALPEMAYTR